MIGIYSIVNTINHNKKLGLKENFPLNISKECALEIVDYLTLKELIKLGDD